MNPIPIFPEPLATICQAITEKRLLQFRYNGHTRVVEPHLVGLNLDDHKALSAFLVRGHTNSAKQPYWRSYLLSKIRELIVLDETFFEPRRGYNPRDPHMKRIYCRLEK
jgi:hypothetical protein